MVTFTKGEIVLVPFLHTNLQETKIRPSLVISEEINKDIILCQITSKKPEQDNHYITVPRNQTQNKRLHIDSYIRCNRIFTIEKSLIIRKVDKIDHNKYLQVVSKITGIIK